MAMQVEEQHATRSIWFHFYFQNKMPVIVVPRRVKNSPEKQKGNQDPNVPVLVLGSSLHAKTNSSWRLLLANCHGEQLQLLSSTGCSKSCSFFFSLFGLTDKRSSSFHSRGARL
mmetsp:Transcript_20187/g.32545  ORF Transcript_20187/g.32545 Transcript_20187/m.32545 type:complete len:114 (+) Transcript_20187:71-412(+)